MHSFYYVATDLSLLFDAHVVEAISGQLVIAAQASFSSFATLPDRLLGIAFVTVPPVSDGPRRGVKRELSEICLYTNENEGKHLHAHTKEKRGRL